MTHTHTHTHIRNDQTSAVRDGRRWHAAVEPHSPAPVTRSPASPPATPRFPPSPHAEAYRTTPCLPQIYLYGDAPRATENVIYLANHQCTVDWFIANVSSGEVGNMGAMQFVLKVRRRGGSILCRAHEIARHGHCGPHRLPRPTRVFAWQDSLRFVPFYGWYWRRHGFVYVRRGWQSDSRRIVTDLQAIQDRDVPVRTAYVDPL